MEAKALKDQGTECIAVLLYVAELVSSPKIAIFSRTNSSPNRTIFCVNIALSLTSKVAAYYPLSQGNNQHYNAIFRILLCNIEIVLQYIVLFVIIKNRFCNFIN